MKIYQAVNVWIFLSVCFADKDDDEDLGPLIIEKINTGIAKHQFPFWHNNGNATLQTLFTWRNISTKYLTANKKA